MIEQDPVIELARQWGAAPGDIVAGMKGNRISVAHWRHNVREFNEPVPLNFVAFLLKPAFAERIKGARSMRPGLAPGSIMIAPAGIGGRWAFQTEIETLHVYLPQSLLDLFARSGGHIELHDNLDVEDPVIARLMQDILGAMGRTETGNLYADTLGVALAARLAERHSLGARVDTARSGGLAGWQLKRVSDYLMAHLAEDVTLAELAAIADLSPHHFCRAFRQSTGLPPHAWLVARRMERAQEMMTAHPHMGLIEIAFAIGYQSQAAFGAAFRRATGLSPGQWRRGRAG